MRWAFIVLPALVIALVAALVLVQSGTAADPLKINGIRLSSADSEPNYPTISGQYVVWEEDRGVDAQIWLYNLTTNSSRPLSPHLGNQFAPAISGDRVVWQDKRNGNWDIYLYNITTGVEAPVCTDPAKQVRPRISGDAIVWTDYRNGNPDIYRYDLGTQTEQPVCIDPATQ
ncbi:TolB family protein [Methanosphaerula palustris]|uniref:Periplasmic component of the Tol biopolymer transport system-like protein n=1 Tax=Methanosphaerula palustris (strain ATCC BAA-1556 / DSM 19958 / E1-9c) TaxID=521011 RepID=B8GKI4_METPE|nr:periplasmic component of the Tol biopolymer transport system-like protein [Methanosphaerula palustris E1-9c]